MNINKKKKQLRFAVPLLILFLLGGCGTTSTLYYWGSYEDLIYKMYNKPGQATSTEQIEKLTQDIQKAEASGQKIPPGLYAHLGVMYAAEGNMGKAQAALIEEKTLFPESTAFIDGMLARANNIQNNNK